MKKLFPVILLIAGLTATHATAQTFMPAKQVTVVTTNWTTLSPSTNTAQSVFDYIDTEGVGGGTNVIGSGGYGTNTFVNPATWQQILQTPSVSTSGVVAGGFYLPGTNIVGATYDETNKQWTVDSQADGFYDGTNLFGSALNLTNKVVPALSAFKTSSQGINPSVAGYFFVTNFTSPSAFTNDYGVWNPANSTFRTEKQGVFAITDSRTHTVYPPALVGLITYGPLIRVYEFPSDLSATNVIDYQIDDFMYIGAATNLAASNRKSITAFHNATSDVTTITFQYYVNTTIGITQNNHRVSIHYLGEYE